MRGRDVLAIRPSRGGCYTRLMRARRVLVAENRPQRLYPAFAVGKDPMFA